MSGIENNNEYDERQCHVRRLQHKNGERPNYNMIEDFSVYSYYRK